MPRLVMAPKTGELRAARCSAAFRLPRIPFAPLMRRWHRPLIHLKPYKQHAIFMAAALHRAPRRSRSDPIGAF
jgi:hypothetical protein